MFRRSHTHSYSHTGADEGDPRRPVPRRREYPPDPSDSSEYHVATDPSGLIPRVVNSIHGLSARFEEDHVRVSIGGWDWDLRLEGYGRGDSIQSVSRGRLTATEVQLGELSAPFPGILDGEAGDGFGYSVAVDDDTVVVGARWDDDQGLDSGSAYVFTEPSTGWATTSTAAKLTAFVGVYSASAHDGDGDGLIEVSSLAQLNAVRWDLDGDGISTEPGFGTAFPGTSSGVGCPSSGCTGYELTTNLEFDTNADGNPDSGDDYWNGGLGWVPVGDLDDLFGAVFDGNGHTVSNLFINRTTDDYVGLFGVLRIFSVARNVGIVSANISGNDEVGVLAGRNNGTITQSYATGDAEGITVGGLVGVNFSSGVISASYAAVNVTGGQAGGLTGEHTGEIIASYATGSVSGDGFVGGLVGLTAGTITASYWDTETSGQSADISGTGQREAGKGKTTSELQSPTGYEGIYADWDVDTDDADGDNNTETGGDMPWDFGDSGQYPVLKVNFDGNGTASWEEFGQQR